ncbi:MAG TPA: hypothetical protein VK716_14330 [Terracidiphilus sp.]|jgi:hypothetical protein|nr:hypothetical protein [Terracidiphilus sp.]
MKFLRDESGEVLVFPGLFGTRGQLRAAELHGEGARKPGLADAQPSVIRRRAAHCCFYCRWCEASILLEHNSMGMMFGQPAVRQIDARSIATICRGCGHVGDYSLFRACHGFETRHKIIDSEAVGKTILVDWLHCEEKTCTARVPFFMTMENPMEEMEGRKLEASWLWEGVECASGHPIVPTTLGIWGKG